MAFVNRELSRKLRNEQLRVSHKQVLSVTIRLIEISTHMKCPPILPVEIKFRHFCSSICSIKRFISYNFESDVSQMWYIGLVVASKLDKFDNQKIGNKFQNGDLFSN